MVRQTLFTRWFALLFLASMASELTNSLLVHFPGYLLGLGANELRIGYIVGVSGVASILVRPWIGRVMDLHSRRLLIRIGTLVVVASTVAYAFIDHLGPAVVAARLGQGLGQAMTMTAFWTYIADRVPAEHRTQGIALFGISGLAPIGIAPAMGDLILKGSWGYRGVFLVAAGFSLVSFGLSLLIDRSGVSTGAATTGFLTVLRDRDLRPIWFVTCVLSVGFTAAFVFVKTFVTTSGLGSVGPFFGAYAAVAVGWRLLFSWVPDRYGPARLLAPGLIFYAAGLAIVGTMAGTAGLVLGGTFTGLGHGISFPIVVGLVATRAGAGDRGTATAIFTALFDLGLFGVSPLLGWVIGVAGYRPMFVGVAAVIVVGMVIFFLAEHRWLPLARMPKDEPATALIPHV